MPEERVGEREFPGLTAAVSRIDQVLKLLTESSEHTKKHNDHLGMVVDKMVEHLENMTTTFEMAERHLAASARLEGELRESIAKASRLIDRLPGKRHGNYPEEEE